MPKLTTTPNTASNAAIAANASRSSIIVRNESIYPCRWSFGSNYVAADDQALEAGDRLNIEGPAAQLAVSFFGGNNSSYLAITLV